MDLINEDDVSRKIIQPAIARLESQTIPLLGATLENIVREALDGATVTITINLKAKS
jgi:hypothetical protein